MRQTPRKLPLWARRLFHQRNTDDAVHTGHDLGWEGPDAEIEFDDTYRFEALAAASTGREMYEAGNAFLRKVLANYDRMVRDIIHDPELAEAVDHACGPLGKDLAKAAAGIKSVMGDLGYGPGADHDRRPWMPGQPNSL
jgi:hypothetical protein